MLHKFIGPQYLETVISPDIGSQAREVISKYTAEEIYTSRNKIQEQIHNATRKSLGANLDKLVQPEATEQPDPKGYNDFLQGSIARLGVYCEEEPGLRPPRTACTVTLSSCAVSYDLNWPVLSRHHRYA